MMTRAKNPPAVAPPAAAAGPRPRWSVMIPTYNCADYLRQSLGSVLAQDPGPEVMQIQVVDDCSTADNPEAVVQDIGRGRVEFYRQPANSGHCRNFNSCIERARGELVHILHGDDWAGEGFYARMGALFDAHPEIGSGFCRHIVTYPDGQTQRISPLEREEAGVLEGWLERIAGELPLQPPSMVVRRSSYEQVGAFDTRMLSCGEDWEMWVRLAAHFPVGYEPSILAFYRDNPESLTKRSIRNGQNIRDVRHATNIARTYLTTPSSRAANRRARVAWARWALHWAGLLVERRDYRAAAVQLREALLLSRGPYVLRETAKIVRKAAGQIHRARLGIEGQA